MKYGFTRENEDDLIVIEVTIFAKNGILYPFEFALDTGATHSILDYTALTMTDLALPKKQEMKTYQALSGMIECPIYETAQVEFLGLQLNQVEIGVFDFLGNGILLPFDGILGLDLLKDTVLVIDSKHSRLWFSND